LVYGVSFVLMLIAAMALAVAIGPAPDVSRSIGFGLVVGVGWVATSFGVNYLFAGRRLPLFAVDAGYNVVLFALMGLIIGAVRLRGAPQGSAPALSYFAPWLERDLAEAGCHVQAGHAFDADRLQRDLVVAAAHQHVGAEAEAHRRVSGRTGILAGQRALRHLAGANTAHTM
jgi:hypothetical protein